MTHIFLFLPKWVTSVNCGISVPDPTKIRIAYGAALGIGGALTFLLHAIFCSFRRNIGVVVSETTQENRQKNG